MEYNKITVGFVIQRFKDGKPESQEFICGDDVTYEDLNGEVITNPFDNDLANEPYLPFDMKQPTESIPHVGCPVCGADDCFREGVH